MFSVCQRPTSEETVDSFSVPVAQQVTNVPRIWLSWWLDCVWSQSKLSITTKLRIYSTCVLPILLYGSETWTLIQADWNKLDSFHVRCQRRILHIRWHDFVSNDEVLHCTGLFDVSYIVCKRRLSLFGHVARLRRDVPANQVLRICTKSRDGERPSQEWRRACGRPSTTWTPRSAATRV